MAAVYSMHFNMLELLKKHFGYDEFRPMQAEIIAHAADGKDALVLMPTGGGKSLCYQLPALKFSGMTVVISPLIALMKDQVDSLRANGITAAYMNSSLNAAEMFRVESEARAGKLKLLYLAPERLEMPLVQDFLRELSVSLFAIDEAHCISEWGHDFRPDYRNLRVLRRIFPGVPVMALTATANERVKEDIIKQLGLQAGRVFQSSFNRENLNYRVVPKKKAMDILVNEIRARKDESVIVYCFSRKGTEKAAEALLANGIKAAAYHAGLTPLHRSRVQDKFIRDEISVITATIAFGMGIDKPDVRLVVHMDMPKSVEGYYQETGRAGRDGLPSDCLMFFSLGDRFKHELFIREMEDPAERQRTRQQLDEIVRYCELKTCRRTYLMTYFGETWTQENCGGCDICKPMPLASVGGASSLARGGTDEGELEFDRELFERLRAIRRSLAEARGVPPYVIFGDKTLQAMAWYLPQRMESMANIFGVGKEKLVQYAPRFLDEICSYAHDHGAMEREIPKVSGQTRAASRGPKVVKPLSDTVRMSMQYFAEKKTPKQIAAVRRLAEGTILQHLEQALDMGKLTDASHVTFPSIERFEAIRGAFQKEGTTMLAPIVAKLGNVYSYDEVRLARFILKIKNAIR